MLVVGWGRYKWYLSQIPGDVPVRKLRPEGAGHSKDAGPQIVVDLEAPTLIGEGNEYQQGHWALGGRL